MEIGLTETVRKMASVGALPTAQEKELLFCWDLARVDFGQRKLLVASNAATRLCAITRMAAADWRRIDEVALRLVEDAVGSAGLDAGRYVELAGKPCLTKTHGRRALGCMNDLSRVLDPASIDMGEKLQWREMVLLNCRLIAKCAGHEGYGVPAERFAEDLRSLLERFDGSPRQAWRTGPALHVAKTRIVGLRPRIDDGAPLEAGNGASALAQLTKQR